MSEWLERELARELAPVAAPQNLRVRLGLAPASRWEFPREALGVAAAVVMIMGGGFAASRTAALDLRHETIVEFASETPATADRLLRCGGGAVIPLQMNAGQATILLAHSGPAVESHVLATPEVGCGLCHSL